MTFKYKNSLPLRIALYTIILLQVTVLFITVAKFAKIFDLVSQNLPLEIAEILLSLLLICLSVFFLGMKYKVEQGKIRVLIGFFDMSGGRFQIDKILSLVQRQSDGKLFMNTADATTGNPYVIEIRIESAQHHAFYDCLYRINPKIEFLEDKTESK